VNKRYYTREKLQLLLSTQSISAGFRRAIELALQVGTDQAIEALGEAWSPTFSNPTDAQVSRRDCEGE